MIIKPLVKCLDDDNDPEKSINNHIDFVLVYFSKFSIFNELRRYKIPELSEEFVEEATEYMDILHFYINERHLLNPLRRNAAETLFHTLAKFATNLLRCNMGATMSSA